MKKRQVKGIAMKKSREVFDQVRFFSCYSLSNKAETFLAGCRAKSRAHRTPVWYVGIHVRRTNYLPHLEVIQNGTGVRAEFFLRAIDKLKDSLMIEFGELRKVC